jgi:hypothetical protein
MNDPAELSQLQSDVPPGRLTVLPCGGHMGYLGTKWIQNRLAHLFP